MRVQAALAWLLAAAALATAAPPTVTLPETVSGEPAAFVVVKAKIDGATAAKFVALDPGLSVFPGGLLKAEDTTVVVAQKAGRYRVLCYSGNADGPSEPAVTTVVIGGATVPPIGADPPKGPPAQPAKKYHFMLVYPSDVGVPADVRRSHALPAWADIEKAGHTYGVLSYFALKPDAQAKLSGKPLPLVAVWEHTAGGKMALTDTTKPLPADDSQVRELIK